MPDSDQERLIAADQPRRRSYFLAGQPECTFGSRHEVAHERRRHWGDKQRAARILGTECAPLLALPCPYPAGNPTTCPLDMVFHGRRVEGEAEVRAWWSPVFSRWTPLDPRLDLVNHSPIGPEWGYPGSGPAQLALAASALVVGDERALAVYMRVKDALFTNLPCEEWLLHAADLETVMLALENGLEARQLAGLVKRLTTSDPHA